MQSLQAHNTHGARKAVIYARVSTHKQLTRSFLRCVLGCKRIYSFYFRFTIIFALFTNSAGFGGVVDDPFHGAAFYSGKGWGIRIAGGGLR